MGIYRSSPRIYENGKDPRNVAEGLTDLGVVYFELGNCDFALGHFERAFRLAEKIGYEAVMANVLNNLSVISAVQGYLDRAVLHGQDCLARYGKLQDRFGLAQAYNNLGMVYLEKRASQNALDCFEKGLHVSHRLESCALVATIYVNKADYNLRRSDFRAASHFCELASGLYRQLGDYRGIAETEKIFGLIAFSSGDPQRARALLEHALELTKRHGTYYALAEVYRELGSFYRKKGYRRKAYAALSTAFSSFEQLGSKKKAGQIKSELYQLHKSRRFKKDA
ncbi:MAG: tetratricopeptide repeat protein [Gemmatimonadota bacterium]|nr:MAG: tetratricopeptide repeat protein [Gemmatimonadota bacterium]